MIPNFLAQLDSIHPRHIYIRNYNIYRPLSLRTKFLESLKAIIIMKKHLTFKFFYIIKDQSNVEIWIIYNLKL